MTLEDRALDLADLDRKLKMVLALHPPRALIAVIHGPLEMVGAVQRLVEGRLASRDAAEAVVEVVTEDDACAARLSTLNAQRDVLLRAVGAIVLFVTSEAGARLLRRVAPDLTAAPDLWVRVALRAETRPWASVADGIRAAMRAAHGHLDLTGLVPPGVAVHRRPLDDVYCPLIDLAAPAWPRRDGEAATRGWVVLGGPGTGKTTFLRYTALRLARGEDALGCGPLVPVLVPLAEYGLDRERRAVTTLVAWTGRWLAEQGVAGAQVLGEHLGKVALLLDGLDEVRDAGARRAILAEVAGLTASARVGAVVIGARTFIVDELRESELQSLRVVQTPRKLDEGWVREVVRRLVWRSASADAVADRILGEPDLRNLAATPLLVTFLVVLHETEGRLPERRVEIYYRLGELLADRWTRTRSLGAAEQRHSRGAAMRVLGPLAWWVVERGGAPIPELELLDQLVALESRVGPPKTAEKNARALLDLLRMDTAALAPRADGRWEFAHVSIAEYLAAAEAERDPKRWRQLLDDPFDPTLREVVVLAIAHLSVIEGRYERAEELAEAVLRRSRRRGRYDGRYVILIAGVLEAQPDLGERTVVALVERMLELGLDRVYPRQTARVVQRQVIETFVVLSSTPHKRVVGAMLARWLTAECDWTKVLRASALSREEARALLAETGLELPVLIALVGGPFFLVFAPLMGHLFGLSLRPFYERLAASDDVRLRLVAAYHVVDAGLRHELDQTALLADPIVAPFPQIVEATLALRAATPAPEGTPDLGAIRGR